MTTNLDYECLFYTSLKLLHSQAKSSTDQLKALLDEVLAQKSEKNVTVDNIKVNDSRVFKEAQKRPAKQPIIPLIKSKKPKSHSSPSSRNSSPDRGKLKMDKEEKLEPKKPPPVEEDSETTDVEEESTDAGEFALEMGLACVVCEKIDLTPGNQLVECQECHNLYHQECHKPPITDRDISDPRKIWYCAKCTKNMEKQSKKNVKGNNKSPNATSSASFQSAINSGRETAYQLIKAKQAEKESNTNTIQPFKRLEMKVPTSNGSLGGNGPSTPQKPTGLAGFAASVSRTTVSSNISTASANSVSTSNNQSKPTTSSSTLASSTSASISKADKRIQQMKKKASSKKILHEK